MIEIADKTSQQPGPILTPDRANEKGVIILESTLTGNGLGTKSFFCRRPVATVRSHGAFAEIAFDGQKEYPSCKNITDLFNIIEDLSSRICGNPFTAGYVSYEFACRSLFDGKNTRSAEMIPEYLFNLYRSVLIYDHQRDIYRATDPDADDYADALLFDNIAAYDSRHAKMRNKLDDELLEEQAEKSKEVTRVCRESMKKHKENL